MILVTKTCVCVCVCVFPFRLFWTSSSLDVPAGVTHENGHRGFLIHLPSAVHAFIILARRVQPFLSLVDREIEFLMRKTPSYRDSKSRPNVSEGYEVTN